LESIDFRAKSRILAGRLKEKYHILRAFSLLLILDIQINNNFRFINAFTLVLNVERKKEI
jgi:hypothetical protein